MKQTPVTLSELKKLINSMDETIYGERIVYTEDRTGSIKGFITDISTTSGIPASPEGSAAALWYGVSPGEKPKFILQFRQGEPNVAA